MPSDFFAFGSTLANTVNFETILDIPVHSLEGRIPSLGPVKERDLAGFLTRAGKINSKLVSDIPRDSARVAFNMAAFGDQLTASAELYISALDDTGHYSPFLVIMDRPVEVEDYQPTPGGKRVCALTYNLFDCRLQSLTKTSGYTVTTSDHLIYADTSSGSITLALPPVATVNPNVIYSAVKTSASNSMVLNPDGAETINGASTLTKTALNERVDYYTRDNLTWLIL